MKILLDECVTKHLKPYLSDNEVYTVRELQWSGIKNGRLMELCVENKFDVILTIDKNLKYQQNLHKYPLIIIIINSFTSKIEELVTFLPSLKNQINQFEKYNAYFIDK